MFVKDGWSSPYSFFLRLYAIELDRCQNMNGVEQTRPVSARSKQDEAGRRTEKAFAQLMMEAKYGGVMLGNGDVVSVDRAFLSRVTNIHPFMHAYFNFETGEIGTVDASRSRQLKYRIMHNMRHMISTQPFPILLLTIATIAAAIGIAAGVTYAATGGTLQIFQVLLTALAIETALLVALIAPTIARDIAAKRRARASCRTYSGGHLILPDQVYDEFVRSYYASKPKPETEGAAGRPRHPAYEWYGQRGFSRKQLGMSMKELQAQMPKDGNGNPPSETTIREWEREHLQRKPSAET